MNLHHAYSRVSRAFGTMLSAGAVVAAIQADRKPKSSDLVRLGIDPRTFMSIGHG